jgi:hypothetical protein
MPTRRPPLFSPSGLFKHLRTGSVCMPHHILTTWTEPCGFIKSSGQNKAAHTQLSGSSTLGTVGHQLQPKILDMTGPLQWQTAGKPYTPYQDTNPPLCTFTFPPCNGREKTRFHHLSTRPAYLLNPGQGSGLRTSMPQGFWWQMS